MSDVKIQEEPIYRSTLEPGEKFRSGKDFILSKFPQAEKTLRKSGNKFNSKMNQKARKKWRRERLSTAAEIARVSLEGERDDLTSLANSNGFNRRIKEIAEREKHSLFRSTVIVADVNNLKVTNDTKGHAEGNKLLQRVALALKGNTRETDIVARTGGDEFTIVLVRTGLDGAKTWRERIEESLLKMELNLSIGLVELDPNDVEGSIKKADAEMYENKRKYKENQLKTQATANISTPEALEPAKI